VRPDGNETFVQNGWIRASERKLATTSENMFKQAPTPVEPIPTFLAADAQAMPPGESVPVTIPLYFQGHAYRAGSRIRVTISAPNGTQPVWSFSQTQPEGGTAEVSIAFGPGMPASLTLPIVPGVKRAHRTAALPKPAQRALPPLPGICEQRFLTATGAPMPDNHLPHVDLARRVRRRAGPEPENPLGKRGREVHSWHLGDERANDADATAQGWLMRPRGAYVMGRNMFGADPRRVG